LFFSAQYDRYDEEEVTDAGISGRCCVTKKSRCRSERCCVLRVADAPSGWLLNV